VPVDPTLERERAMFAAGETVVIGLDEVGRGAMAGPVMVGACAITAEVGAFPAGLRDSKLVSEKKRLALDPLVREWGVIAVGAASPQEIDQYGITFSLGLAGKRALALLFEAGVPVGHSHVILDGSHDWLTPALASPLKITTAVKADQNCASVAAASVAAKVERDALMAQLSQDFAEFGWASNKGYGSAEHMRLIAEQGPTIHHRVSWVKK
jgi:ribonuclease HII